MRLKNFAWKKKAVELTVLETPEQNGDSECFDRTIMEAARRLLMDWKLPNSVVKNKNTTSAFKQFSIQNGLSDHQKIFLLSFLKKQMTPVKYPSLTEKLQSVCSLATLITEQLVCCEVQNTRHLFISGNVMFNENKPQDFELKPKI